MPVPKDAQYIGCVTYSNVRFCDYCGQEIKDRSSWQREYADQFVRMVEQQKVMMSQAHYAQMQQQILANEELRQALERLRNKDENMYTTEEQRIYRYSRHFNGSASCNRHDRYRCETCFKVAIEEMQTEEDEEQFEEMDDRNSRLPALIVRGEEVKDTDKQKMKESFTAQTEFVKKALKLTDKQVDAIKVKDLVKKVKEGEEKITVGQMRELIKDKVKDKGVVETIVLKTKKFFNI